MKKLIIANWKMNLSLTEAQDFVRALKRSAAVKQSRAVIAAPFTMLVALGKQTKGSPIALAAQNVSEHLFGAYTGEVSAKMLKETGSKYSLVGHSERRIYFNETDDQIREKSLRLLEQNIVPVICVGENAEERRKGLTEVTLSRQLTKALRGIEQAQKIVIAYEPVWAISTFQKTKAKKSATPAEISEAHAYIRKVLGELFSKKSATAITVIYGGTVTAQNAQQILSVAGVDGALVGGASLNLESFTAILNTK